MSGHTKRILYAVCTVAGECIAFVSAVLGWCYCAQRSWPVLSSFVAFFVFLPLNVLVHELGHIFFGLVTNMKFVSLKLGRILFFRENKKLKCRVCISTVAAGECALFPKTDRRVRSCFLAATLGGAIFNFTYGIVFLLLYFLAEQHPVLLFFEMFAPVSLIEGVAALIPVELDAGKTDGLVALGLIKKSPEEEIALRVLRAQAILYKQTFSEVPEALLFDVPVVREDLSALHALMLLRMQYLLWEGKEEEASLILHCVREGESFSVEEKAEFERYDMANAAEHVHGNDLLFGVRALEEKLCGAREK